MTSTNMCPNCGYGNQEDSRFCGRCGASLSPTQAERPVLWFFGGVIGAVVLAAIALFFIRSAFFFNTPPQSETQATATTTPTPWPRAGEPPAEPAVSDSAIAEEVTVSDEIISVTGTAFSVSVHTKVPTIQPTSTDTPLPTYTPGPTATQIPTNTIVPSPIIEPADTEISLPATSNCEPVKGVFVNTGAQVQELIGCATGPVISGLVVEENFQNGKMFWREPLDYAQVLTLFDNGTWQIFEHAPYNEGDPEFPCVDENTPAQSPPTPKRGFGTTWCDIPAIRNGLGNAIDAERGYTGSMQQFDRGSMLMTDNGAIYSLFANGVWERR